MRTTNSCLPESILLPCAAAAALALSAVAAPSARAELLGHWPLDETYAPSAGKECHDASGHRYHGDFQPLDGAGPTLGVPSVNPSLYQTAARFNAEEGDEVVVYKHGAKEALGKLTQNFTLAAWVKPSSVEGEHQVFCVNPPGGWGLRIIDGALRFTTFGKQDFDQAATIPANAWTHLAVTFDERFTATFYVNGQAIGSVEGWGPADPSENNWFIGSNGYDEHFAGVIDDVRVYDQVLSPEEIRDLAKR